MFDTHKFLTDHFTDADGVIGLLGAHGFPTPQKPAVVKWFSRSSVPWEWGVLLIIVACNETKTPVDLGAYIKGERHDIFQ
jgi:hypothetical protein